MVIRLFYVSKFSGKIHKSVLFRISVFFWCKCVSECESLNAYAMSMAV